MVLAFSGEGQLIVGDIRELTVQGAFDRGVPNQERIVLQANEIVNMGQFALLLGIRREMGSAIPIFDNFYWFGDGILSRGDWIFVYTGPGKARVNDVPNTNEKIYTVHWGRGETVLTSIEVVPALIRIDAVQVLLEESALPDHAMQNLK